MPGRRGLWQVFVLVLLVHAALLTQLSAAPGALRGQAGLPVQLLYVRLTQPPLAPEPPAPATATLSPSTPAPEPAPALRHAPQVEASPPPLPSVEARAGTGAEPVVVAQAPASAASAPAGEAPYLPRGDLTVAPKLLTPVQVPFPDEVEGMVDLKIRISLFIDEQGVVRRIRIDTPDVPPVFERTVREAFSAARFAPGQLEATAVRSQIRLEVEFAAKGRARTR